MALVVKNPPANAGDKRHVSLIPGLGRSPGGGHGNSLQYSCLENPWTEEPVRLQSGGGVARVTKSQTRLKRLNMHILISTVYHHSQHPTWPAFWTASVIQKSLGFFKCRQIQVHFALCYILKYWTLTEFHKFKLEKFTKGIVTEFFCKINHCFQYE